MNTVFLTAEWRYLAMLNYRIDPLLLEPYVPAETELDFFHNQAFVSIVGFQFLHTRIFGVPVPFHINFEEVNLRFYVRRKSAEGWRRGVVFIREIVPSRAIAFIARTFYNEPYIALPMRHRIDLTASTVRVEYSWRRSGELEFIRATGKGGAQPVQPNSEEEFITEHYWGYTSQKIGSTEYQVEHPRWRLWTCHESKLHANISELYGDRFAETLCDPPSSAFIAEGSRVVVRKPMAFADH